MEKIDKAYEGFLTEKDEAVTIRRIRIKIANAKDFSENLFYKLHYSSHSIHVPVYFFNGNETGAFARIVQNSYNDLMVEIMGHCDLDIFKWHDTGELIVQMFPGGCAVAHNRKPEPPSNVLIKEGSDVERPVMKQERQLNEIEINAISESLFGHKQIIIIRVPDHAADNEDLYDDLRKWVKEKYPDRKVIALPRSVEIQIFDRLTFPRGTHKVYDSRRKPHE